MGQQAVGGEDADEGDLVIGARSAQLFVFARGAARA